jgi:Flp pilus assembly protein TadG
MGRFWKRFFRAREGNVAIITALAAIPMCFLVGMSVDYGTAADRQVQLNAYADAAALAAVTPSMMAQGVAQSTTAAQNTFNGQASSLSSITYSPANLNVTISTSGSKRTVTVAYTATYNTFFPSLLGRSTMALSGSSTATGGLSPNINFFLLLDDSPSMAIAATTSGISTMISNTQGQCDPNSPPAGGAHCGCAFGCHESNPAGESHCNAATCGLSGTGNPGGEDNYALARALGVTLRIDLLSSAAANLMTTAQSTEEGNDASYQMAIYSFDTGVNAIQSLTSNLSTAQNSAGNVGLLEVYQNNMLTSSNNNNDEDTNYEVAMSSLNSAMPNPGSGTNTAGDTPQEVLFLVTDGVEDECETPTLNSYSSGGCRQQYLMNSNTDYCTAIKNRGIRIAVLYTEYLPITNNGWYENFDGLGSGINSFQSQIANQMESCASPGLFYEVDTDGDISAALASLFQSAVQSSYLSR